MAAQHHRLIIVGSGPAGYTAAVYAARAALTPVIITGVEVGGQMTTTTEVDNWPGDDQGVMGPELMERMKRHAERFGTKLIHNHVDRVELKSTAVSFVLRQGRIHLRRVDRRDRRVGEVSRPTDRRGLQGPRRVGVRNVRRLLLQEPTGRRRRRRQYGRRGSAVSLEHRVARDRRAPARRVSRRADHDRQARRAQPHRQRRHPLRSRARRGRRRRSRRHGRALEAREERRRPQGRRAGRIHRDRAYAEHRAFSRASSRWTAATSSLARVSAASPLPRASKACLPPATSPIRSTVRPSPRRDRAAWPHSTPSAFLQKADSSIMRTGAELVGIR